MTIGQVSIVPIHCTRTKLPPASADADCIAFCDNTGQPYLCKGNEDQPLLAATEWICSHLARDCGLPVPPCHIIEIKGRKGLFFGSEWQGGAGTNWAAALPRVENGFVFSRTIAFDYTAHNVDRHLNNYLYLDLAGDIVIKIIDFSRAWTFHGWPLPLLPMKSTENTIGAYGVWSRMHPLVQTEVDSVRDNWNSLPKGHMDTILSGMPCGWIDAPTAQILTAWWDSADRTARSNDAWKCLP